jgi:hypothetical protein
MAERKFYIESTTGQKFEISELDFNNLKGRVNRGQTNGWYMQRGDTMGDVADWRIQVKDIAMFYADKDAPKKEPARNVDVNKRTPVEPGDKDEKVVQEPKCVHNWLDPDCYEYVTQIVSGINRYYKQCNECGAKSQLIKKREVEIAMEAKGLSINDVPLVK